MNDNFRLFAISLFVTAILFLSVGESLGDVTFKFTPSQNGGVVVTGTGSGVSTADTTTDDFDSQDYNTDFLADTHRTSITVADTIVGTLTNITTGVTEDIVRFRVDRDPDSADDIDFITASPMTFSVGDEFSLKLTATFDFLTLPFGALIPGVHTEDGGEFPDENFGQYTVFVLSNPVCDSSGTLVEGFGEINDFNATCGADNTYWGAHGATFAFQITDPVSQFELVATAPSGVGIGTINVNVEASKESDNGNLNIRALLFNFASGNYEALPGILALTTHDAARNFELPGGADPNDFVEPGTNNVQLLIQTIQTSGQANVRTQLDEVLFNFQ